MVDELPDAFITPGFTDSHVHLIWGSDSLDRVGLGGARNLADMLARLKAFADAHPERDWIVGAGWGLGALEQSPYHSGGSCYRFGT